MGRRKNGRDIDGIVLLNKPLGCSSNTALQRVRRAFDARKAGHTGSLDPLASGLLPICLGEATKVSGYLLSAAKHYRVIAAVGAETETGDREGAFTQQSDVKLPDRAALEDRLADFAGPQQQIPPMYSALKLDGKRLYELARAGETVERAPRDIVVHSIELLACDADSFELDVRVSGGTYIRTLVEDIARALGTRAYVWALHRVGVGALGGELPMISLDDIEASAGQFEALADYLLPLSTIVADWPEIVLDDDQVHAIGHGQPVSCDRPGNSRTDESDSLLRIVDRDGRMLGFGMFAERGRLVSKRLFTRPQR